VEHGSGHLLARTLIEGAEQRGIVIPEGQEIREWPGEGVEGRVEGRQVAVGGWSFIVRRYPLSEPELYRLRERVSGPGLRAYVAVDGKAAGMVEYADRIRPKLPEFLKGLRGLGVRHLVLLSGDDPANASAVAQAVGIEEAHGGLLPEEKVAFVQRLVKVGSRVLMVGDGTNDAPALSAATVGIALAGSGGGISAEAADAVILTDDPTRVGEAIAISRRTLRLARQSIVAGLGLSMAAMMFASFGFVPPVLGALLQEGIDVLVILNALRASLPPHQQLTPQVASAAFDPA
jgi:cation transport ATPase